LEEERWNMKTYTITIITTILLVLTTIIVAATPTGPKSIESGNSERADLLYGEQTVNAQAGNVTELNISANAITEAWQGYYGSISGTIILEDAQNNTFYNWSMTTPSGEIYASPNSSITWSAIECFNYTDPGSENLNLSQMEAMFNMGATDSDGLNETFNDTTPSAITIGSITLGAGRCPATYVYDNSGPQETNFLNFLATDNTSIVFGTVLVDDQTGFDSGTYDFQMLVAEDGQNGDSTETPYYFWVELN
jgi:hypothetical protein